MPRKTKTAKRNARHRRQRNQRKVTATKHMTRLNAHPQLQQVMAVLREHTRVNAESKEAPHVVYGKVLEMARSLFKSTSTGPYKFELSGYSRLATTAGSVLQLTDYAANPRIPMCISVGGVDYSSDFTYLTSLFDQIVVYGLSIDYEPANPYNRGVSTISYPCYVAYDNDALITPTTSVAGMRAQSERGIQFKMFSPDHTMHHYFQRPGWGSNWLASYPWADINSVGTSTETSVLGCVFFGGDGTQTASTTYGAVRHMYHVYLQNRL